MSELRLPITLTCKVERIGKLMLRNPHNVSAITAVPVVWLLLLILSKHTLADFASIISELIQGITFTTVESIVYH